MECRNLWPRNYCQSADSSVAHLVSGIVVWSLLGLLFWLVFSITTLRGICGRWWQYHVIRRFYVPPTEPCPHDEETRNIMGLVRDDVIVTRPWPKRPQQLVVLSTLPGQMSLLCYVFKVNAGRGVVPSLAFKYHFGHNYYLVRPFFSLLYSRL